MAFTLTTYGKGKLAGVFPQGLASGVPATWYLALATAITNATTGAFTEATGTGYARATIDASDAAWSGTSPQCVNAADISYPTPGGNWSSGANMTHIVLTDASSGGNVWGYWDITTPQPVLSGQAAPVIAAGALQLTAGG
jgi:hypothetical protein